MEPMLNSGKAMLTSAGGLSTRRNSQPGQLYVFSVRIRKRDLNACSDKRATIGAVKAGSQMGRNRGSLDCAEMDYDSDRGTTTSSKARELVNKSSIERPLYFIAQVRGLASTNFNPPLL
jgi:hypothetical protein